MSTAGDLLGVAVRSSDVLMQLQIVRLLWPTWPRWYFCDA